MADETDKDNGDYLGYGVYAETLWNRIQAALDKDLGSGKTLGDDPLVIGIFGEWGAGKSTLLKLTLDRASDYEAQRARHRSGADGGFGDTGFGLTVPVLFQPWKYEHEPHLLVPLLLHIIQALRDSIPKGQTLSEKTAQFADKVWSSSIEALPALVENFEAVYKATVADLAVADPVTTAGVSIGFKTAGWLAKLLNRPDDADWLRDFKFSTEGRFYYNFHNVLYALTRPGRRAEAIGKLKLSSNARINFVIFIDDLDRCLPEKAVEALELIKTVFNLESFAFVLALDEEVVERGIGHRYKDYALQNKKPEMPITGFEYLEKIVHLPFRLPGLTKDQARRFLERYESEEVAPKQPERWWFAHTPKVESEETPRIEDASMLGADRNDVASADLSALVLSAFTAYVPRKLVRLIELLHQVQEIALRRGKKLTVGGDSGIDVRVVAALVMIQLFQPDLYRLVRRKPQALPLLLAAFAKRGNGHQDFSDPDISDVDLWLWVVEESAGEGNDWIHTCSISETMNAVVHRIAKNYHVVTDYGQSVQYETNDEDGRRVTVTEFDTVKTRQKRSRSQNVKLPLVAQILEHRAAQRHVFDPLRLTHALAGAMETDWSAKEDAGASPAASLQVSPYFSLMVPAMDPHWALYFGYPGVLPSEEDRKNGRLFPDITLAGSDTVQTSRSTSGRILVTQHVKFPDRLLADIVSQQTEVQANLLANNELETGKFIDKNAAENLLLRLREWRGVNAQSEHLETLKRGLQVVAPLIPRELGAAFLKLVDDTSKPPYWVEGAPEVFDNAEDLRRAAERADFWTALGADKRFNPKRFHLPSERLARNQDDTEREPIPGFVRVLAKEREEFKLFSGPTVVLRQFYMARYLTTVDQYASYIAAEGYGDPHGERPEWWDTLGWLWRTGQWDSQVKDEAYRNRLARRMPELRGTPKMWSEQLLFGSRPVMGLGWFEARAYAAWLTIQLREELEGLAYGYAVRLSNEAQWERAVRAVDTVHTDQRQYPWIGADQASAHLRANIGPSGIGRPSLVGLFAPNPLGLCDLCGNLWELQNNLYRRDGSGQENGLTFDVSSLQTLEEMDKPALRGGTWFSPADGARASFRLADRPAGWLDDVGFRVVLSAAVQTP